MSAPPCIGHYQVVRQIGRGGMGVVYEALDPRIHRKVAIKLLRPDILAEYPELTERLSVEAQAANRIGHPGVVQVTDVGVAEDGSSYLVMELLEGETLSQRQHKSGGRLPIPTAVGLALQIVRVLLAGHEKGVLHRDLKPDNIMLVPDTGAVGGERVKLLDFGIARISDEVSNSRLTRPSFVLGTPGYTAPEQLRSLAAASAESDVYSLGAVLFCMLTGQPPHVAPSQADLVTAILLKEAPLLSERLPGAPRELVNLVRRMLVREPMEQRPSMAQVEQELASVPCRVDGKGAELSSPRAAPSGRLQRQEPTALSRQTAAVPARREAARQRWEGWLLVASVAVVAICLVVFFKRRQPAPAARESVRAPAAPLRLPEPEQQPHVSRNVPKPPELKSGAPGEKSPDVPPIEGPRIDGPRIDGPRKPVVRRTVETGPVKSTAPRQNPELEEKQLRTQIIRLLQRASQACPPGAEGSSAGCPSLEILKSEYAQYATGEQKNLGPLLVNFRKTLCRKFGEKKWRECP